VAGRRDVRFLVMTDDASWTTIGENLPKLLRMAGSADISRQSIEGIAAAVTPLGTLALDRVSSLDAGADKQRLEKELAALAKHIAGTEARLANPAFTGKAPPDVLAGARRQLSEQQAKQGELKRLLESLG